MEKFIKLFLLIVVLSTTAFFIYADYDAIIGGRMLSLYEWLITIATLITSFFAIPSIIFWYKMLLFDCNFIFKDIDKSDKEFLADFKNLALLSFIHSLLLFISIAIFLSRIIFNPTANIYSFFIIFLLLLLFITIAGINKITLNKIKTV